jgi:hypothetical protein
VSITQYSLCGRSQPLNVEHGLGAAHLNTPFGVAAMEAPGNSLMSVYAFPRHVPRLKIVLVGGGRRSSVISEWGNTD